MLENMAFAHDDTAWTPSLGGVAGLSPSEHQRVLGSMRNLDARRAAIAIDALQALQAACTVRSRPREHVVEAVDEILDELEGVSQLDFDGGHLFAMAQARVARIARWHDEHADVEAAYARAATLVSLNFDRAVLASELAAYRYDRGDVAGAYRALQPAMTDVESGQAPAPTLALAYARVNLDAAAICESTGNDEAFKHHVGIASDWAAFAGDADIEYTTTVVRAQVLRDINERDECAVLVDRAWQLRRTATAPPNPHVLATEMRLARACNRRAQVEVTLRECLAGVLVADERFGGDVLRALGTEGVIELGVPDVAAKWCAYRADVAARRIVTVTTTKERVFHAADAIIAVREAEAVLDLDPDTSQRVQAQAHRLRNAIFREIDPIIVEVSDGAQQRYEDGGVRALGYETEAIAEVIGEFYSPRSAGPWWLKAAHVYALDAETMPSPSVGRSAAFSESRRCFERAARAFDQAVDTRGLAVAARERAHDVYLGRSPGLGR